MLINNFKFNVLNIIVTLRKNGMARTNRNILILFSLHNIECS